MDRTGSVSRGGGVGTPSSIQERANALKLAQRKGGCRAAAQMAVTGEDLKKTIDKGSGFFKHLISGSREAKRAIQGAIDNGNMEALKELAEKGSGYRTLIASTLGSILADSSWTGKRGASLGGTGSAISPDTRANAVKLFSELATAKTFTPGDIKHVFAKFSSGAEVDKLIHTLKGEASISGIEDGTLDAFRGISENFGGKKAASETADSATRRAAAQVRDQTPWAMPLDPGALQAARQRLGKTIPDGDSERSEGG